MKTRKTELDVDFIGGQGALTKKEEKMISDFLKKRSLKKKRANTIKKTTGRKVAA